MGTILCIIAFGFGFAVIVNKILVADEHFSLGFYVVRFTHPVT